MKIEIVTEGDITVELKIEMGLKVCNFESLLRSLSQRIFVQHTLVQCGELS